MRMTKFTTLSNDDVLLDVADALWVSEYDVGLIESLKS